jgi:hypothetical protein
MMWVILLFWGSQRKQALADGSDNSRVPLSHLHHSQNTMDLYIVLASTFKIVFILYYFFQCPLAIFSLGSYWVCIATNYHQLSATNIRLQFSHQSVSIIRLSTCCWHCSPHMVLKSLCKGPCPVGPRCAPSYCHCHYSLFICQVAT